MSWINRLALAVLLVPSVAGQDSAPEPFERFQFYNACRPVGLLVEELPRDAKKIGLSTKAVRLAAESRLRAARLYTDTPTSWLLVKVLVLGDAFSVSVSFAKWVTDRSGLSGPAPTWSSRGLGTHAGESTYIRSHLSDYLDEFLNEYLRVNAEACGGPSP